MPEVRSHHLMSASFALVAAPHLLKAIDASSGRATSSSAAALRPRGEPPGSVAISSRAFATSQRRCEPAVDRDNRAGHERTCTRRKEYRRAGDVVETTDARQR